jgi:hypothetical protein
MRNGHDAIAGGQGLQSEEKHQLALSRKHCGWAAKKTPKVSKKI